MKRNKTTTVLALVVALLLAATAGSYGAIAHNRAIARAKAETPATIGDAVATAQPAADGQTQPASTVSAPTQATVTPATNASSTAATTSKPSSGSSSKPPATTPPATRPPETSRGGDVHSPLTGKTIFVDAGHGIPGSGANGPNGGDEAANNLATALILRDMLQGAGARVVMTRTTMINPTIAGVTSDQLEARTIMANKSGANIFVSLHENMSDESSSARGLTVYYRGSDAASIKLAQKIDTTTVASTGWYNWGTAVGPYYVLNHSSLKAAVLVECGFLSNATDEQLLGTNAFRQKIAQGVFNGIVAYFQ